MAQEQSLHSVTGIGLAQPAAIQPRRRLLVIDDDPATCMLLERLGQKVGFFAMRAASVEAATTLLRAEQFDCITLDLGLGRSSGIEVLKVLADVGSSACVIIISASKQSMREFAASIGNTMRLSLQKTFAKPIDFAKLKMTLAEVREKAELCRKTKPAA